MVFYNASTRELTAKIVYYGPGLGGKTTNLQVLHRRLDPGTAGELLALSTETDRTIYFDLLPVELGDIKGYKIRFQLATVPGQTAFNETRRVVLKGADGVVFVADSQWRMLPKNLESWQSLKENLAANGIAFETMPVAIQYNKRDLPDILSVDAMQEALGFAAYPHVEAVASEGRGVTETFKLISKLTFLDLLRRLQERPPGEGAGAVVAGTPDAAGGPAIPPEALDRRPPLTLVRPAREGVGEAAPSGALAPGSESLEPPFAEAVDAAAGTSAAAELEERLRVLEAKFEEGWEPLRSRLSALEQRAVGAERAALTWETKLRETQDGFGRDLAALERRMADRIPALEERFEERTSSLARDLEELQRRLSEAALQARRGTDAKLAPIIEEQVRREADENWTAEIERLRQALAESLEDLSERVRKAVRG